MNLILVAGTCVVVIAGVVFGGLWAAREFLKTLQTAQQASADIAAETVRSVLQGVFGNGEPATQIPGLDIEQETVPPWFPDTEDDPLMFSDDVGQQRLKEAGWMGPETPQTN